MTLLRQGRRFAMVGVLQFLADWWLFMLLTGLGVSVPVGNLVGRMCGAGLGFWFNGRYTFSSDKAAALGWRQFSKYALLWLVLTYVSTALITAIDRQIGLHGAWLIKPLVEGVLSIATFFLCRQMVYR